MPIHKSPLSEDVVPLRGLSYLIYWLPHDQAGRQELTPALAERTVAAAEVFH